MVVYRIACDGPDKEVYCNSKGSLCIRKRMNFRKISESGGGVISDPKNFIADFCVEMPNILVMTFGKNCNIFSEIGAGGSKAVRKFSKCHKLLE